MDWRAGQAQNSPPNLASMSPFPAPPPLSNQRLCPSNTGRWFRQFRSVDFGGVFFNLFYCLPCVLRDTLVFGKKKVDDKAALLAKRAFVACLTSWFSE